mmetsp:Transcript_37758/g.99847  ORF Transcript_37758/g.99847 Transcript_37758/m.99847 type:complete len:208 (+) Transcript_37758:1209-1832(+)
MPPAGAAAFVASSSPKAVIAIRGDRPRRIHCRSRGFLSAAAALLFGMAMVRMASATPSAELDATTWRATSLSCGTALPIATGWPTSCIISRSFSPSPTAMTPAASTPSSSSRVRTAAPLEVPSGSTSSVQSSAFTTRAGCPRSAFSSRVRSSGTASSLEHSRSSFEVVVEVSLPGGTEALTALTTHHGASLRPSATHAAGSSHCASS